MKVSHALTCFFLLFSLQDGNTGIVSAQLTVYSGTEGEDVRVRCFFSSRGAWKFFCKETCRQKDILIETNGDSAQRGRYRMGYEDGYYLVTISQLTKSDSGRYRCGKGSYLSSASYEYIEVIVVDAMLDEYTSEDITISTRPGGNILVECSFSQYMRGKYFCKEECEGDILVEMTSKDTVKGRYRIRYVEGSNEGFVYVSIKQLTQSDSGWYRCGLDRTSSEHLYQRFRLTVTDALTSSTPSSSVPSASSPTTNQSESSLTTAASSNTTEQPETSTTRGVVLYVGLTLAVLFIVSSLSVLVFCRKRICKAKEPHVETQHASAPEAEDDPGQPVYSEITFVSGVQGDADCVVYSVPRVDSSSDEPPLYSLLTQSRS